MRKQAAFRCIVGVLEDAYDIGVGRQPSLYELLHDLDVLMPWMERDEMMARLRLVASEEMSAS